MLGEHAATAAVAYTIGSVGKRRRQPVGALPVSFQQMKRNALCGLLTDTRHATQAVDKANQ
jgi:hypothetical protein